MKMSSALTTKMLFNLDEKILIHDLYLAANLLHPLICDFSFVSDASKRSNYLERAKVYVRWELSRLRNDASADTEERPDQDNTPPSTATEGAAKFSMTELYGKHGVSLRRALQRQDELASVDNLSDLEETFLSSDELEIVYYWKRRSSMYPDLYKVALRIFATPASSCQSERMFFS